MMQPENKFIEYVDAMVTCEIAMQMAFKYKEPVNKIVAATARRVSMRCADKQNRNVFLGLSQSEFPATLLYQFRTMFDEAISK